MTSRHSLRQPHFRYVLFDLGGTLIFFDGEWQDVIQQSTRAATISLLSQGYPLDGQTFPIAYRDLMMRYYQRRSDEEAEYTAEYILREAVQCTNSISPSVLHLRNALKAQFSVSQAHWHPEVDAAPMLASLAASGYRMGIVSNASDDDDVQLLVEQAGLTSYFDFILTSASFGFRKPSPMIFQKALSYWKAEPAQAVMVGDTVLADVVGANRSGLASVWITRRADNSENHESAKQFIPDKVIKTLSELPGLLAEWRE